MIIDLLDLDLAAGRHWIDLVVEEMRAQRRAEMRAKNRAAWLDKQGRHAEASGCGPGVNACGGEPERFPELTRKPLVPLAFHALDRPSEAAIVTVRKPRIADGTAADQNRGHDQRRASSSASGEAWPGAGPDQCRPATALAGAAGGQTDGQAGSAA
jgi:hypothetical protein